VSALSESSNGSGVRTGAEEPAIVGGDVFDKAGSLALSETPGARRLVPLESIDPLGGDASKALAEFKLGASASDDAPAWSLESREPALDWFAEYSEPENDFEMGCDAEGGAVLGSAPVLVPEASEPGVEVLEDSGVSSRISTSTSLFSRRSRRPRFWNGSLGTRGMRGLLSRGNFGVSTDSGRLLKTFENDFRGTNKPPLDGDSRTVLAGFGRDAEGAKTRLKSPVTAPDGGGGSSKVSSWLNPVPPKARRAIATVGINKVSRSTRPLPTMPRTGVP